MLTTAENWQIISRRVFFRHRSRASILTFASVTVRYRIGSDIVEMDHRYLFMYQTVKSKD
ncbi:hypothetical protein NC652_008641 [Populus alba x Populus x berolinensis]|nr:hypothetical protein NC652_008641 [Populus alba x Populus x berolinensis]